jgi:hypothetical protein
MFPDFVSIRACRAEALAKAGEFVVSSDRPVTRISHLNGSRHAKRCQRDYEQDYRQSNVGAARTSDNFDLRRCSPDFRVCLRATDQ